MCTCVEIDYRVQACYLLIDADSAATLVFRHQTAAHVSGIHFQHRSLLYPQQGVFSGTEDNTEKPNSLEVYDCGPVEGWWITGLYTGEAVSIGLSQVCSSSLRK